MRLSVVVKFARVLMISRLRSTRRSFVSRSLTNRPLLIIVLGTILFIAALLAGVATVWFLRTGNFTPLEVEQLVITVFGGAPIFLVGFYFTMGLLWELNASTEAESTDAINWLPISPGEYVAASSLSTSYTYSPVLMIALGYAFPVALFSSNMLAFLLLIPVALISSMTGSVGVEILRSGLARASTAFSRIGGRTMILLRILGIMLILVLTQILFSGFIIASVIGTLVAGADVASFVPIFWLTLALTRALVADLISSIIFLTLGLGFLVALSWAALSLRAKYWVVPSGSPHLSSTGSISKPGRLGSLGLGPTSLALLRREIRAATRRKEALRLTVIPIIIPVLIGFPLGLSPTPPTNGSGSEGLVSAVLGGPLLFGVGLGALILAMTSLGQEGKSLWNLGALPVTASMLVRAKILITALVSTIGLGLGAVVSVLLFSFSYYSLATFAMLGITLITVEASLGVAVGSRFSDFSEGPRPKFVTITGSIIGTIIGLAAMGITLMPLGLALAVRFFYGITLPLSLALSGSVGLGIILAWASYKLALPPVQNILSELPS